MNNLKVIKKNGQFEDFDKQKIIIAIGKSALRVNKTLSEETNNKIVNIVLGSIHKKNFKIIRVNDLHEMVQEALSLVDEEVYREYFSYRDYKKKFSKIFMDVVGKSNKIIYSGDKENANKNSLLVSTKKGLVVGELGREIMLEYELPKDIAEAHKNGDLYCHDNSDRYFKSINCCLFDMANLLKDGFNLNGVQHTEPTSAESFMRVFSDIVLEASSQQYGGFSIPNIDTVGAKYVKKALEKSEKYYTDNIGDKLTKKEIKSLAYKYVERALDQGFQAVETRLNTLSSANCQTPFVTFSLGLDTSFEGRMVTKAILKNRMNGIGKQRITPVFPKLVFLHRDEINGIEGSPNYDLYDMALECMMIRMYPDMLSLNAGYLGEMWDKYGLAITNMGCRAYLSPWYKRGGMYPADENDVPVFTGRANCGAVTLNTVRYAIESKGNKEEYFKLLDKNFDKALRLHLWTYNDLKNVKASSNPLFFCEGGCHIRLKPDDSIEEAIKTFTWSFGYIGLNEASYLMIGKEIHEDNSFAIEVLEHFNERIEEAKKEHGLLFALYGTPAESLCYKFRDLDYEKYGEIPNVTDKSYYMNSFHVNVNAHISPIDKQKIEAPMFHLSVGGRIQYVEFPTVKNKKAIKQVVDNGMKLGLYQGVNLELDSCDDCYESGEFNNHTCPTCGSENITEVCRVCGYIGYKKLNGDTRFNDGKYDETEDRVDHTGLCLYDDGNIMIKDFDINNGEGNRVSVWMYGCPHHCKNCHNPSLWEKKTMNNLTGEKIQYIMELLEKDCSKDLSILGGEPLVAYNLNDVTTICKTTKKMYPNKNIWVWTGYLFEDVKDLEVMKYIDVLVDGKFVEDLKNEKLEWKGSSNQRVIDVQNSLKQGDIVLYN